MKNAARAMVFTLVLLLTLPMTITYFVAYYLVIVLLNRRRGISGTAYEPFTARLLMHDVGEREDEAAARLARALPATAPWLWPLMSLPIQWAVRLSGTTPALLRYPPEHPPGLMALMTLRTEFFDETLREALGQVEQLVILGAGWDTRCYDLPTDAGVRFFEVDAPATSRAKQAAVAKAGLDADHVTFVATDFNERTWLEALVEHGFEANRPTFVLWEGVSMYLEDHAVDATLRTVASFPPGSRIAFDYLAEELVRGEPPFRLLGPYMTASIGLTYGEHMVFGLPTKPDAKTAASAFVAAHGLTLRRYAAIGHSDEGQVPWYGFVLAGAGAEADE